MYPLVLISGLAPGGAERVTASLLIRLHGAGLAVPVCTVTARHDGPIAHELERHGVRRLDLGARRLADPRALVRLGRLLRTERIDLVHAHGQDAAILAAALRSTPAVGRVPLVVTRHVLEEPRGDRRQRWRARLALGSFRRADASVAVSAAAAERLARQARIPRDRIHLIPNGIDVAAFARRASGPARARLLRELELPRDARLVLFPAILRPGKGHGLLFRALPAIRERVPGVRVLLAGDGPLGSELRRAAGRFGPAVRFLGHRSDMPDLMAGSDLVILPSTAEALPTVLMEAAAAGRPVVATRVGGVPEIVSHEETGLLVTPGDANGLAAAIVTLLHAPERAHAMGLRAKARARAHFSLERQLERTVALWDETVARRSA